MDKGNLSYRALTAYAKELDVSFGRKPIPKWKNIKELSEEDVKSFKCEPSQPKVVG